MVYNNREHFFLTFHNYIITKRKSQIGIHIIVPLNNYFNNFGAKNEQKLVEDLIIEQIKIYGIDVLYVPASFVNKDTLLGEDPSRAFVKAFTIEMYFENVDGFMGDKNFQDMMGLNIDKQATFIVSSHRFDQIVNSNGAWCEPNSSLSGNYIRPTEGDVIWIPLTNDLFEINFADHESIFYQFGKTFIWKISCSKFNFSHETFATQHPEIDSLAAQLENNDSVVNDPQQDNDAINNKISDFLDTSVQNPFVG